MSRHVGRPPRWQRRPGRGKGIPLSRRKPPARPCKRCAGTGFEPHLDGEVCILCDGMGDL